MSKVIRNPKHDAPADGYDFKNAKRGVFYQRAKIGIKTFEVTDADDRDHNIEKENRREGTGGKPLCSECAGLS